jgi:prepilin-type N-terminal cleavage/methylation domain-containing protein
MGVLMRRMRREQGFTLIELLVVIAIVAILAALLFPVFSEAKLRAKITRVRSDLRQVATAIEVYRDDCGGLPPVRSTCMYNSTADYYQAPLELVRLRYLATRRMMDPFNATVTGDESDQGRSYKYLAIGWGYGNANSKTKFGMYIPRDYPACEGECDYYYLSSKDKRIYRLGDTKPCQPAITWAVWSVGPSGDKAYATELGPVVPVDRKTWYPHNEGGVIALFSDRRGSR